MVCTDDGEEPAVVAFSENGRIIEVLSHESLPIRAAQWHLERMTGAHRYAHEG